MFTGTCNCSIDDAGDGNEFHHEEWRTARKVHACGECGRAIQKGERYERVRGKSDGEIFEAKTCLGCTRIRQHWMPDGWYYGTVAESVAECIGFNYVTGEEG